VSSFHSRYDDRLAMARSSIKNQPPLRSERQSGRFIWQVIALAAVGFVVRLVYIWQIRESPFFDVLMATRVDTTRGPWRSRPATGLARTCFTRRLSIRIFWDPLRDRGHSLLMVRLQAVIGTTACVLLALAARRLYSERAGLIAGSALHLRSCHFL
jgi:hypothetical protein